MIAFVTDDDWTAAQVTITATGTDSYTFAADENDANSAMTALVDWANANATFAGAVFSWSFDRHDAQSGAQVTLSCDTSFSATFDAEAQTLLGFSASYSSTTSAAAPNSAAGTIYGARSGFRQHILSPDRDASTAGNGTAAPTVSAWRPFRPRVEELGDWSLPARVRDVMASATNPRTAYVYDGGFWRGYAVGEVVRERVGASLFRVSFACLGEVA